MTETRTEASKMRTAKDVDSDQLFVNTNATKHELGELVQRLAYDDKFRAALEADPVSVLAEYHVTLPTHSFRERIELPSKEALQETIGAGDMQPNAFIVFIAFLAFLAK